MNKIINNKNLELHKAALGFVKYISDNPNDQKLMLEIIKPIYLNILGEWDYYIRYIRNYFQSMVFEQFKYEILNKNGIKLIHAGIDRNQLLKNCVGLFLEMYDYDISERFLEPDKSENISKNIACKKTSSKFSRKEKIELSKQIRINAKDFCKNPVELNFVDEFIRPKIIGFYETDSSWLRKECFNSQLIDLKHGANDIIEEARLNGFVFIIREAIKLSNDMLLEYYHLFHAIREGKMGDADLNIYTKIC